MEALALAPCASLEHTLMHLLVWPDAHKPQSTLFRQGQSTQHGNPSALSFVNQIVNQGAVEAI